MYQPPTNVMVYQYRDTLVMDNGVRIIIAPENQFTRYVRVKKHHKRRIDKKWEKRYGYKNVPSSSQCYYASGLHAVVCSQSFYDNVLRKCLVI